MTGHYRRVVITGLGVVAPTGIGKEQFWQACLSGRSGIRSITCFDASNLATRIAGEVPDFDPLARGLTQDEVATLDRGTQFALVASMLAMSDARHLRRLGEAERATIGVYIGTAMSSGDEGERIWTQLTGRGEHQPRAAPLEQHVDRLLHSYVPASVIAAHHGLHGPCAVFATGCSAGADAIGQAYWAIQQGRAARMLAGGADSAINASGINVFSVMKALSTRNDQPEAASRPYDGERDGFVMAEGAGVLLLEERELALARGAHIYAEIIAYASNSNAYHMTSLPEDGQPLQDLLRQVMQEARITPRQLGYINSHGSSTPANDKAETAAYKAIFGQSAYNIPISSTKSMIGHSQGAASAIEAIVTALALDQHILPPTINQHTPDPACDLDYIPNIAREASIEVALTHSSGFGGVNTALVLSRSEIGGIAEHPGNTRRVVITGLGVVAPNGIGKEAFWHATRNGISGIQPIGRFPARGFPIQVAGEVGAFDVENFLDRKLARRTDRVTHLALAAVEEAVRDAGLELPGERPHRVGAVLANTLGGVEFVVEQIHALHARGPRAMSAYTAIAWLQTANVGQVSLRYGIQGYCKAPVNDLAGGLDALGVAYHAIQRGVADVIIAGGSEAPVHPFMLPILAQSGHFAEGNETSAYRPFDTRARGLILAEGAGICILEDYEHALRRGATIYGEIVGYSQTCDARTFRSPVVDGSHYARAITVAMQEARLEPTELAYFSLDGHATPAADLAEADALRRVFGPQAADLPVTVPRTMLGHSLAAAGAIDTVTALLALQHGMIPPTINSRQLDSRYQCQLVRDEAVPHHGTAVLLGGRSLNGVNVALAIKKVE